LTRERSYNHQVKFTERYVPLNVVIPMKKKYKDFYVAACI